MSEITTLDENEFEYRGRFLKIRVYSDGVWELLNENGLPEVQGQFELSKFMPSTRDKP